MTILRAVRYAAWVAVAVAVLMAFTVALGWWQVDGPGKPAIVRQEQAAIGGPFSLTDHRGRTISERDFLGRPLLVFFGFTHCPDVCPTTLFETTERLKALGADADRVQVLFVSVDPGRDTPERLADYVSSFDPRIIAATGSRDQIDAMVRVFRATYRYTATNGDDYTVEHTASMFMMASSGAFVGTIDFHEPRETAIVKLRRLAKL